MNAKSYLLAALITLLVLAGCIVGDQLTTLTVNPDGSAEYVIFRSNLHSTEVGAKADKEVADYKSGFDARANDEFARIKAAGGHIVATTWLRDAAPMSNVVHARFPDATARSSSKISAPTSSRVAPSSTRPALTSMSVSCVRKSSEFDATLIDGDGLQP